MRNLFRRLIDRSFTLTALFSVLLMAAALVIVLGPIVARGATALVFRGTEEWRRFQYHYFGRGSKEEVAAGYRRYNEARRPIYDVITQFKDSIVDLEGLASQADDRYDAFKDNLPPAIDESANLMLKLKVKREARGLRDALQEAYQSKKREDIFRHLETVESYDPQAALGDAPADLVRPFFDLVREYRADATRFRATATAMDVTRMHDYKAELAEIEGLLYELFGPPEGEPPRAQLEQYKYGATRMDMARRALDKILWKETYVSQGEGKRLRKELRSRKDFFEGTQLARLFPMLEENLESILEPRRTFYPQFFTDGSTPGHFFGGVGKEVLGTLLFTTLAMVFSVPVGVITAAWLVDCTSDNVFVRFVRMCINTLAGVPSIVFGLFGVAFFILYFLPMLRLPGKPSILAGSLTLAVLALPVIIRASEEAIRAVPQSYKEASLAVGAGGFRTFIKVTLPAALPGILTGIILSLSRAAGETAPLLFTGAVFAKTGPVTSLLDTSPCLSVVGFYVAVGDNIAPKVPHNQYGIVMTLVLLVLLLNIVAILVRSRMSRKLRGQ